MSSIPNHIETPNIHHETTYGSYTNLGQNVSGQGVIINYYQTAYQLQEELQKYCSPSAASDSASRFNSPRCDESARAEIIQIIEEWINSDPEDNSLPSSLFWLYGSPEVGKSALAQSLADKFQAKKQLAASFFFFGTDDSRNNGALLIPTLVSDLIDSFEGIAPFVEDRIRKNRALFKKIFRIQIQELLLEPLLALKSHEGPASHPRLIIIDGLNECQNPDIQCELLRAIGRAIPQIPYPLRFLVTSRPEAHIINLFNHDHDIQAITALQLNLDDGPSVIDTTTDDPESIHIEIDATETTPPSTPPSPVCLPFPSSNYLSPESPISDQEPQTPPDSATSNGSSLASPMTVRSDSDIHDRPMPDFSSWKDDTSRLGRSCATKISSSRSYGRGAGNEVKEKRRGIVIEDISVLPGNKAPLYPAMRARSASPQLSRPTQDFSPDTVPAQDTTRLYVVQQRPRSRSISPNLRPPIASHNESTSTLVGSAYERKITDHDSIHSGADTTKRLEEMRRLMARDDLQYYVVPSKDAHGLEHVASSDRRCEFISGFTGPAGHAIITAGSAFLIVDSRYWTQAESEIDDNWTLVRAAVGAPHHWIDWLLGCVDHSRIGIDARMISHKDAILANTKIVQTGSKLVYPPRNLVDVIWEGKPEKSLEKVYLHAIEFTGNNGTSKLGKLRGWIRQQPPDKSNPNVRGLTAVPVGTLVSDLNCIAYILNLQGSDIPYKPLFHAYLFVGLNLTILFVERQKLGIEVADYLISLGVEQRGYTDLWPFLRRREWGDGQVLITPDTPYAISLMLASSNYAVRPSYVEYMMNVKNETEIECLKRAYLRDGVSFVRFLAWLESKLAKGYNITEYEALWRLTEYRRKNRHFLHLAYAPISASGPNAALHHHSPEKNNTSLISVDLPYLNDSGAQYLDGTCGTARTMHFGQPTAEMREAYTRVLQGHIAVDSATFPEGTSDRQLGIFARKALWRDGLNDIHSTGHGFGTFLTVRKGFHASSGNVPLFPGRVIANESGLYVEGQWGMRIDSALVVRKIFRNSASGAGRQSDGVCLSFERLTCVPIQTKMLKESMLTKEEKVWLKDHNQRCYDKVSPLLTNDERALKWLKTETSPSKLLGLFKLW